MSKVVVPQGAVDIAYKQTGKFVRPKVEPSLFKKFSVIKEEMLSEFDKHPVTRELQDGVSADSSQFVSHGSLFGFIGFEKNDKVKVYYTVFQKIYIYHPTVKNSDNLILHWYDSV